MQLLFKQSLLKLMETPEGQEAVVLIIEALVSLQPSEQPKAPEPETPDTHRAGCRCCICEEAAYLDRLTPEGGLRTLTEKEHQKIMAEVRAAVED